jgi:S1-C subfamily serine protease
MDLKVRSRRERIGALGGAAFVACALTLSASAAAAQDRGTQVRIVDEQRRQLEEPSGWFGVTINENGSIDEHGDAFFTGYPVVTTVEPGSPAEKAGVKKGDILITFNDHDMKGSAVALRDWLQPGSSFVVRLRRDGAAKQVRGTVGNRPAGFGKRVTLIWTAPEEGEGSMATGMSSAPNPTMNVRLRTPLPAKLPPVMLGPFSFGGGVYPFAGAEFTALNPDLSEALGVKHEGVFVTTVLDGSPARAAGLRGGDIVLSADSIRLDGPLALVRAIRESNDRSIKLGILRIEKNRQKKPQTILLRW